MLVNGTAGAESLAAFGEFQFWVLSSVYIGHVCNPASVVSMIFRRGYPTHGFRLVVTVCNGGWFPRSSSCNLVLRGFTRTLGSAFFPAHVFLDLVLMKQGAGRGYSSVYCGLCLGSCKARFWCTCRAWCGFIDADKQIPKADHL